MERIKTATKPLRPKNIYSQFSINEFIKANKDVWVIINLKTDPICVYGKNIRNIKNKFYKFYPSEKILTVKKIK